jgi:hypothetical protein
MLHAKSQDQYVDKICSFGWRNRRLPPHSINTISCRRSRARCLIWLLWYVLLHVHRRAKFVDDVPGYLIKENKDYGTELALGNSVVLLGSAIPRIIKTGGRAPVPIALGATGLLATYYYQKKVREFRYGV